jgi:hypothetical protein
MRNSLAIVISLLFVIPSAAKDKPVAALQNVRSVFVLGNSEAADEIRKRMTDNKSCFELATKAGEADATLDLNAHGVADGGEYGRMLGSNNWVISGTVTLKSGDQVWSKSERFADSPFRSGAKTAGKLLLGDLEKASGCKGRK